MKAKAKAKKGDAAVDDVAIAASKAGGGAPRGAHVSWVERSRALKGSDSLGSDVEFLGGSPSKLVPEEHRGDASYLVYILYDFQT